MYGQDTDAQLKAMGLVGGDLKVANDSYNTGNWVQGLQGLSKGIGAGAQLAGQVGGMFRS